MSFDLKKYLKERQKLVEKRLGQLVKSGRPTRLHESMRYSLLAGGKRLRPILVLAGAEACGGRSASVIDAACAIECIHTYSLIHDDLPAMDDDDLRRGRPTNHKAFDEPTAILAGDALLNIAFEIMTRKRTGKAAQRWLEATQILATASGSRGMIGGQMVDIQSEGQKTSRSTLAYIHAHKTGALLTAPLEMGAVLTGATAKKRRHLKTFGEKIGLAFQIADDILNVQGDEKKLGKKTGSDADRHKATYPALFGLEKAKSMADRELHLAMKELKSFGKKGEPLAALARFVVERDH